MPDSPESSPQQASFPPPPVGGPPPPPPAPPSAAPGSAWYYGPFPPPGAPREGFGASLGKTAARGCMWSLAFGAGLLAIFGIFVGIIAALVAALDDGGDDREFVYGREQSGNRLLSIRIGGVILGEEDEYPAGIFSDPNVTFGYEVKQKLIDAALDSTVSGVVLEFQTPGGTIFGSEAIADGIREYQRRTKRPVYAFVAGLSASGGMWAMAPATRILADHGSLLGSIGVRLGSIAYYDGLYATDGGLLGGGVTTKNGITVTSITAGRGKDVGSPFRPLTEEEVRVLQKGVDNSYADFVTHVATSRKISESAIRDQMGALVFDNATAQAYGLIDGTANRQEAYTALARAAGFQDDDWQVVREKENNGALAGLLSESASGARTASASICFPRNMVLAYYGDPAALCPNGR